MAKEHDSDHHSHDHPAHLAHHWDTPAQQFEAGKLGMWLFLATEVLLFGGLFCAYAVWRGHHPELFKYGSQFLDTKLGAINTAVLIASSLTMAWGVTCAQRNQKLGLIVCLVLTLGGAATFLVIKYFEYTHKFHLGLYPGIGFYEPAHHEGGAHTVAAGALHSDAPFAAAGAPAQVDGIEQASRESVPTDHASVMPENAVRAPLSMPSPGGPSASATQSDGVFELQTIAVTPTVALDLPPVDAPSIAPAAIGPSGLSANASLETETISIIQPRTALDHSSLTDPNRPNNTHMFFNIYFMMTGLHAIHVVIGMIVIGWLLVRAARGTFNSDYFAPVDLGGLYWHIVDLIWIFLFPLFYLI